MHYQFELALRQYIAAFNGTNDISPEEFKARFNNLYCKNYTFVPKEEKIIGKDGMMHLKAKAPLTRDQIFKLESSKLASGTKMTLIHFRKIGLDCIDVKVRQVTGQEENTLRVISTLSDSQVVVSREIDESPENNLFYLKGRNNPLPFAQMMDAKFENFVYKYKEFGAYGTNM